MEDKVNHPSHYTRCAVKLEPIEITARLSSCYGQALNYILRAPYKDHLEEDYRKAIFYLNKALEINDLPYIRFEKEPDTFMYLYMFWKHSQDTLRVFKTLFYYCEDEPSFIVNEKSIKKVISILEENISDTDTDTF